MTPPQLVTCGNNRYDLEKLAGEADLRDGLLASPLYDRLWAELDDLNVCWHSSPRGGH